MKLKILKIQIYHLENGELKNVTGTLRLKFSGNQNYVLEIYILVHSYAVEELQLFKNYRDYLLQISELCADGYVLDKQDRSFFANSTKGEVDRFIKYVKENRQKIIDYENLQKVDVKSDSENIVSR